MSIRQVLKARSRVRHEETEALFWGAAGFANAAAYTRYLGAMARAHGRLGLAAATLRGDVQETRHHQAALTALSDDLSVDLSGDLPAELSADGLAAEAAGLGLPDLSNALSCEAQAWGVSYALLGSCLGAQVLARSMADLPWGAQAPMAYLTQASAFAKSGALKQFFAALEAASPDADQATAGAHLVFDLLSAAVQTPSQIIACRRSPVRNIKEVAL